MKKLNKAAQLKNEQTELQNWLVYFKNNFSIRISAKEKDILNSECKLISVIRNDSETLDESIILNLENVLWIEKDNDSNEVE